jgi:hypothetical protein
LVAKYALRPFTTPEDGIVKQAMANGKREQVKQVEHFAKFDCLYEQLSIIPEEALRCSLAKPLWE